MSLSNNKELDKTDIIILDLLQKNSKTSNVELSKKTNLSPPATLERLKKIHKEGYIDQHTIILNKEKLGFDFVFLIFININIHQIEHLEKFENKIKQFPQILECLNITGEYDYMLKAVFKSRKGFQTFITELTLLKSLSKIQTSVIMREVKFTTQLPILKPNL